jgi:ATP-binding cassette subfamily B protein/ATP-binding cassette subfamily B protein RtxE
MIDFLKETLHSRKKLFFSATTMTILLKLFTLSPPLLLGRIIDSLSTADGINTSDITGLLFILCIAVMLQSFIHPLQTYQLVSLVQSTLADMSIRWTKKILGKEFEEFSSLRIGGLIKSVERGITAHEKLLTFILTSGFPLVIESVLMATIFAWVGGANIFIALMGVSVAYLLLYRYLVRWRRPYLLQVNHEEDLLSSRLFETLQAGKIIKLEQACNRAMIPLCQSYEDYARAATKVASTGAILGSAKILYVGLSTAGLLAWGVSDLSSASPRLSVGELVAVFSIAGMFLSNFTALAEAYRTLDQFLVDKRKLKETLSLADLLESPQAPISSHVTSLSVFKIESVTDQQLHFRSGESVAIIGASGAGKTTFLETLAGTLKTNRHLVVVNGQQMRPADIEAYMTRVRYCPQHPMFLEGLFRRSVLFGQEASPDLPNAVDAFGLQELVENRSITEGAKNISGGEAKRLSLLRLVNRPGDFNLFDEPTAALDQQSALRVWNTIFKLFHKKGLICATHDQAALRRFDRVIVIRNGAVIADGPWMDVANDRIVASTLAELTLRPD